MLEEVRETGVLRRLREGAVPHHEFDGGEGDAARGRDDHLEAVREDLPGGRPLQLGALGPEGEDGQNRQAEDPEPHAPAPSP